MTRFAKENKERKNAIKITKKSKIKVLNPKKDERKKPLFRYASIETFYLQIITLF